MDSASKKAEPNNFIPEWIKLDFDNNSNLKNDIQNRISDDIGNIFIEALNNIKGDYINNYGISFSEITRLAMAYFFSEIFRDNKKNEFYTLEMVKGLLDGNNLTNYTAILEIDVVFYKLHDAKYFHHCWLIIQCAWFFNSEHFGSHQYIDYINHFLKTGVKLSIDNYKFDKFYLEKKYSEIEKKSEDSNNDKIIDGTTLVSHWYYSILFIVCNELQLPISNFNVTSKDNREFNPLTKVPRILRHLTPFKLNECDIKSAFPTFLDLSINSNIKDYVYKNLMVTKNINRNEAKILFNKNCNNGKYLPKKDAILFLKNCGYSDKHCNKIIKLTHDEKRLFYSYMTEYEKDFIEKFQIRNNLKRGTRLHDAIFFIDNKTKPEFLNIDKKCEFDFQELNIPVIKHSFKLSHKLLPYAYINSIPSGLNLISKYDFEKSNIKGEANGFRFYNSTYEYISAGFNCNDHRLIFDEFISKMDLMFNNLKQLNNNEISTFQIESILKNIRENSNIIYNVRAMYLRIIDNNLSEFELKIKKRDFNIIEPLKFKTNTEFIIALNSARRIVTSNKNYNELYCLLENRITNEDYSFIDELKVAGRKKNNLLSFAIINLFNFLCTGFFRKHRNSNKSYALYNEHIKRVTFNSISSNNKTQDMTFKRMIKKYEKDLLALNKLINNRERAKQLFLIVCKISGQDSNLQIEENLKLQNELKLELIQKLNSYKNSNKIKSIEEFDSTYLPKIKNQMPLSKNGKNIYDTNMNKSIFNQLSPAEANSKGEIFFQEYLKFHGLDKKEITQNVIAKKNENYILPEFDFDFLKT